MLVHCFAYWFLIIRYNFYSLVVQKQWNNPEKHFKVKYRLKYILYNFSRKHNAPFQQKLASFKSFYSPFTNDNGNNLTSLAITATILFTRSLCISDNFSLSLSLSLPLSVNEINSHISTASIAATMFHFRFHSRPLFPSLYFPLFLSPLLFFHPPSPPRKPKRSICPITHSNNHSNRNSSSIGERKGAEDRSMALLSPR